MSGGVKSAPLHLTLSFSLALSLSRSLHNPLLTLIGFTLLSTLQ